VCLAGWRLGKRTIDTLTDTAPAGAADKITEIVERVPGIVAIDRIRARRAAGIMFVDLELGLSRTVPLDRVAAVRERTTQAIRAEFPLAEITVTTEPRALDDETVQERVMVIARNRGLAVHHVTVHAVGDRLAVAIDLEVDGALSLSAAHEIASGLEGAVIDELGSDVEVETHIEPLEPDGLAGQDATAGRVTEIQEALAALATDLGFVRDVHDVRVRDTKAGEIVNFHCHVDPDLTVHDVHEKVDAVERGLRRRYPSVKRVVGHAEPKR
jgi:divalent metal cation (Fe/Co/Zn/Cd) transporter